MIISKWKSFNVFQKINILICTYLLVLVVILIWSYCYDLYKIHVSNLSQSSQFTTFYDYITILFGLFLIVILPNAFSIFVHEMRKQMNPPIPKLYTKIKNWIYILMLVGIILPFIIYPMLSSKSPGPIEDIAKGFIHKRHSGIYKDYWGVLLETLGITFICLPIVALLNWFHAISYYVYFKLKSLLK